MSSNTFESTKLDLLNKRGRFCECGCGKEAHDLHHAFIHNIRKSGKTKWPELNDPRNLILVNHDEHIARTFDTLFWRRRFWARQIVRYGEESMQEWIDSLPDKLKMTRLDFL